MKIRINEVLLTLLILSSISLAQLDDVKGDWPFPPFKSTHGLNATFSEYRNTLDFDHFHNAVDIGQADGSPCYSSLDGKVYSLYREGSNAYIRIVSQVGNKWKHLTYLHILPNPSLSVGDSVKKNVTIIGTVISGMGHVHLIERVLGNSIDQYVTEINNIRPNGGLTPYEDTWAPVIHENSLKFFENASQNQLSANKLFGKVDIQIKIEEINGSYSSQRNNGTYLAGYRIWNSDKTQIVYEPDDNGVKYRFDFKPLNSSVNVAFVDNVATLSNPVYWLTNGNGADLINETKEISDNFFDTSLLDKGNYQLEIFSEDTRSNKTNKFFPISIVDPIPNKPIVYYSIFSDSEKQINIKWKLNDESDVAGYRLYYANNNELTSWNLAFDEAKLNENTDNVTISNYFGFIDIPNSPVNYYKMTAVDTAGQESEMSDLFAVTDLKNNDEIFSVLIVNSFDKFDNDGNLISHDFVKPYFSPLNEIVNSKISTAQNDSFLEDMLSVSDLQKFNLVIWFTGDNTNSESTFQIKEMYNLATYLENGGYLLVSGSKIGFDLDVRRNELPADTLFYRHYLKSKFVYVGDETLTPAMGSENTIFKNMVLNYGSLFDEFYPDDVDPINGSVPILNFNSTRSDNITKRNSGIGYKGKFGTSSNNAGMVYITFPLESVSSLEERKLFFNLLLEYFGIIVNIKADTPEIVNSFYLSQNYPNPFNPTTTINYNIPQQFNELKINVKLEVYDILGNTVTTLVNKEQKSGKYTIQFDGSQFASGIYFARLSTANFNKTIAMLLLK